MNLIVQRGGEAVKSKGRAALRRGLSLLITALVGPTSTSVTGTSGTIVVVFVHVTLVIIVIVRILSDTGDGREDAFSNDLISRVVRVNEVTR